MYKGKHRRADGSNAVLDQLIVGYDGQLWFFDRVRHRWSTK